MHLQNKTEVAIHQINNTVTQHGDVVREMIMFKEGAFSDFRTKEKGNIHRFGLFLFLPLLEIHIPVIPTL